MGIRKQPPQPMMNRRMLVLSALLVVLALGMGIGAFLPGGVVGFLFGLLLIVAGTIFFITWDTWRKEYQVWISRPVRVKQSKREVVQ